MVLEHLLIRHKVNDFKAWKRAYDSHLPARQALGLREVHLWRSADDSGDVIVLFEAEDLTKAKLFAESADLRQAMQAAGVVDKPQFLFLKQA